MQPWNNQIRWSISIQISSHEENMHRTPRTLNIAVPYRHASNSRAETSIRTTNNRARTLLAAAKLPSRYWSHAVEEARRNYNREPHQMLPGQQSPMAYIGQPDDIQSRRVTFGAQGPIQVPKDQKKQGTLQTAASPVIVPGYNNTTRRATH